MAHVPMTREKYDALVAAFRERPGEATHAARSAGSQFRTARKYWLEGNKAKGFRPIRDIIEEEQEAARALLQRKREEEATRRAAIAADAAEAAERREAEKRASDATEDRGSARAAEARMSRAARDSVIETLEMCGDLLNASKALRDVLRDQFREGGKVHALAATDPARVVSMLKEIGSIISQGASAAKTVAELERLIVGDPTSTTRVVFDTDAEAAKEILEAIKAAERMGVSLEALAESDDETPALQH